MNRIQSLAALAGIALAACSATETGNPVAGQRLGLRAVSSDDAVVIDGPATAGVSLEQAFVVLDSIRFVPEGSCDDTADDERLDLEGPLVVDLLAGERFDVALRASRYCRVRLPMERLAEARDDVPGELLDHALLLSGTSRAGVPFVVRSRDKREAELRARGAAFDVNTALGSLLLTYDVGRFLAGIELDAAIPEADGRILVDEEHNDELLDAFESNVREALELYRDVNDDGVLDVDERTDSLAVGG